MNNYNVSKRQTMTFEQFLKNAEELQKAKHIEKGEHEMVDKAMAGEVKGAAGFEDNLSDKQAKIKTS